MNNSRHVTNNYKYWKGGVFELADRGAVMFKLGSLIRVTDQIRSYQVNHSVGRVWRRRFFHLFYACLTSQPRTIPSEMAPGLQLVVLVNERNTEQMRTRRAGY